MICAVQDNSEWYRGRINELLPGGDCTVWLVDYGKMLTTSWRNLRYLEDRFLELNEVISIFKLADIEPIDGENFSDECIADFRTICEEATLSIVVKKIRGVLHEVCMAAEFGNDDVIDVCSYLVKKEYAIGVVTVVDPVEKVSNWLSTSQKAGTDSGMDMHSIERTRIKIVHYLSPSEFYVNIYQHMDRLTDLLNTLQTNMSRHKPTDNKAIEWKLRDHCCVRVALPNRPILWHRAVILAIDETCTMFTVYLRDSGLTVSQVTSENITPADESLETVPNGAIRCHLALVGPTDSKDWSMTAKEEFLECTNNFDAIEISIQNGQRTGSSLGVIVWGRIVRSADALSPSLIEWENINDKMVQKGLFQMTDDHISIAGSAAIESVIGTHYHQQQIEDLTNKLIEDNEFGQGSTHKNLMELQDEVVYDLKAWKPPHRVINTVFNAYITMVDEDMVFYLHPCSQKALLDDMKLKISELASKEEYYDKDVQWKPKQPCLAAFVDQLYYRAEVVSVDVEKRNCEVYFIDYGNVEICRYSKMRKVVMFADIPAQAHRYHITNLDPVNANGKWPIKVIQYIHRLVEDKICSIRKLPCYEDTSNREPTPCDITPCGHPDLRVNNSLTLAMY